MQFFEDLPSANVLIPGRWAARIGLSTAFIYSGISKLLDFSGAVVEAAHFGLQPAVWVAVAIIVTQLVGAGLLLFGSGRGLALGALVLAIFILPATFIGHAFWNMEGMDRFHNLNAFLEHAGLVGGLLWLAAWGWSERARP